MLRLIQGRVVQDVRGTKVSVKHYQTRVRIVYFSRNKYVYLKIIDENSGKDGG